MEVVTYFVYIVGRNLCTDSYRLVGSRRSMRAMCCVAASYSGTRNYCVNIYYSNKC